MHASSRSLVILLASALLTGCEGQTLQESVSTNKSLLKVKRTVIDDQGKHRSEAKSIAPKKPELRPLSRHQIRFNVYASSEKFTRRLKEASITNDAYLGRNCPKH